MLVVVFHIWEKNTDHNNVLATFPFNVLIAGHGCVCLFFILSGFVLSYKFIGEVNQADPLIKAIIKRPFRLGGVVIFVSLFALIITGKLFSIPTDILIQIIIQNPLTFAVYDIPPLWTIGIELQGSIMVFVAMIFINGLPVVQRILVLTCCIFVFRNSFFDAFFFGMIIADIIKNNLVSPSKALTIVLLALLPVGLWLFAHNRESNQIGFWVGESLYSMIGAAIVFLFVCFCPATHKILSIKPLIFLGKISFSLYVSHWLIVVTYSSFFKDLMIGFPFLLQSVLLVGVSVLVGWLLTIAIDNPAVKFAGVVASKFKS